VNAAKMINLLCAPEMASIRAVAAALEPNARLGESQEKIHPVLNKNFPRQGLPREEIKMGISTPIKLRSFPQWKNPLHGVHLPFPFVRCTYNATPHNNLCSNNTVYQ
jgi:hypothetical protein